MIRGIWTFFVFVTLALFPLKALGQSNLAEFEVEYASTYQLQKNYTIIYDNSTAAAKINELKIEFFNSAAEKMSDVIITHPKNGNVEVHDLENPIIGFESIKIHIFSLHSGATSDLPNRLSSLLALSLEDEIPDAPTNAAPIANAAQFNIEASRTETFDLSPFFSDDRDGLSLTPSGGQVEGLSFSLTNSGQLTVSAPQNTGTYAFSYVVTDRERENASGIIKIGVVLPAKIQDDLAVLRSDLARLESDLSKLKMNISDVPSLTDEIKSGLENLSKENESLSSTAYSQKNAEFETAVEELTAELNLALSSQDNTKNLIKSIQSRLGDNRRQLDDLISVSQDEGANIGDVAQRLQTLVGEYAALRSETESIKTPKAIGVAQLENWANEHEDLKLKMRPKWSWPALIVTAALVFILLIACLKIFAKGMKSKMGGGPRKPPKSGVIFPSSPLLPGAVTAGPAPLVPSGHMAPSGLQTLTGPYSELKSAYLATGRIGGPQEGVPTNDDVSFGTGFLITPNHIMTNRHVYEFYKHYLTGPDCGGIEFIAERDRDASDYVAFDGEPPILISGLDIAIFKLIRPVNDRTPIDRVSIPTEELDTREMITISYPCPFEVTDVILSVVEDDPIFAVKRLSQGKIFRHSTDTDTPYGVQASVDPQISSNKKLHAICHNASTLGGSSGAPILDLEGNLIGVHFAGYRAFNGKEAANLAMAIERIADANP